MHQNVLLDHHASTATDKSEANRLRGLSVGPVAREMVVLIVHAPQAVRHLGKSERSGTMARALPMVAKALTHDKNVIKHASGTVEQRVPRRDQLHFRQLRSILQHHIVGPFHIRSLLSAPAVVSQRMHKQIPAKLTCESFTEKPQFCLSLLGLLQNKSLIAGSPYKLYTYGSVFKLAGLSKASFEAIAPSRPPMLKMPFIVLLARNQSPNLFTLQRCPSLKGGQ